MFFSIVIPTYNRLPILQKCLKALENQTLSINTQITDYEIVLVDDGSTDNTIEWLTNNHQDFPHVKLYQQDHQGAAA
ncbi:MAG TPA: glycosyltransferase family 2 protein, partial [Allocoleopsis sp.]